MQNIANFLFYIGMLFRQLFPVVLQAFHKIGEMCQIFRPVDF